LSFFFWRNFYSKKIKKNQKIELSTHLGVITPTPIVSIFISSPFSFLILMSASGTSTLSSNNQEDDIKMNANDASKDENELNELKDVSQSDIDTCLQVLKCIHAGKVDLRTESNSQLRTWVMKANNVAEKAIVKFDGLSQEEYRKRYIDRQIKNGLKNRMKQHDK